MEMRPQNFLIGPDWSGIGKAILKWLSLIVLIGVVVHYGSYLLLREPLAPVLVIAHRGGAALAPENTLEAFANAAQIGVDGIELDVRMTKDGVPVVISDETVDRTTNGNGYVRELTWKQLRALRTKNGENIPSFEEVLSLAKSGNLEVFAEIKPGHARIETEIVKIVKKNNYDSKTNFLSFSPQSLQILSAGHPKTRLIPKYNLWQFNLDGMRPEGIKTVAPMAETVLLNPWIIKSAHTRGEKVIAWFGLGALENPVVLDILRAFGVDGMIVNDPAALKKLLDKESSKYKVKS